MTVQERTRPRIAMSAKGRAVTLDGVKIQRVTDVLNAMDKPALKQWAANAAADLAVDRWDELAELPPSKRLDEIRYAHRRVVKAAQVAGTDVHGYGERLVKGEPVDPPDELRGMVESYARFLDEWRIEPIAVETPVAWTGPAPYAGRSDLWARIGVRDNASALIDLKTGKAVYPETSLQLAAYAHADLWQPDGPDSEQPLPGVDLVYVAHVQADHVDMVPALYAATDNEWRVFRYVQQVSRWQHLRTGLNPEASPFGDPERAA